MERGRPGAHRRCVAWTVWGPATPAQARQAPTQAKLLKCSSLLARLEGCGSAPQAAGLAPPLLPASRRRRCRWSTRTRALSRVHALHTRLHAAGTNNDSVYIYDLESSRVTARIPAHRDDVNAVRACMWRPCGVRCPVARVPLCWGPAAAGLMCGALRCGRAGHLPGRHPQHHCLGLR